jgi:hypothetical protein
VFVSVVASDRNVPQKCCQNEKNMLVNNKRCAKNSAGKTPKLALECKEKYILNPSEIAEDAYNVTDNGTLYIYDMDSLLHVNE